MNPEIESGEEEATREMHELILAFWNDIGVKPNAYRVARTAQLMRETLESCNSRDVTGREKKCLSKPY